MASLWKDGVSCSFSNAFIRLHYESLLVITAQKQEQWVRLGEFFVWVADAIAQSICKQEKSSRCCQSWRVFVSVQICTKLHRHTPRHAPHFNILTPHWGSPNSEFRMLVPFQFMSVNWIELARRPTGWQIGVRIGMREIQHITNSFSVNVSLV